MTVVLLFIAVLIAETEAFTPFISARRFDSKLLALSTAHAAKDNLLSIVQRLNSDQGIFVYDTTAKNELTQAVAELIAVANVPTKEDFETTFQGDWSLRVTTATTATTTNAGGFQFSKLPSFLNQGPFKDIRETLNRSVRVQQRIRSTTNSTVVDRVDHVIEFQPPDKLMDVLGTNLPDALRSINVNPLEVSKAKVTLVHKATMESVTPKLRTKIALESVICKYSFYCLIFPIPSPIACLLPFDVVTVAGTSQLLDPKGADVLGINIPLGEFLNSGTFETTYMDETLRISTGKLGIVEQLRVFTKTSNRITVEAEVNTVESSGTDETVKKDSEININGGVDEKTIKDESVEGEEMLEPPESNRI